MLPPLKWTPREMRAIESAYLESVEKALNPGPPPPPPVEPPSNYSDWFLGEFNG